MITDDLSWGAHIEYVTGKANRVLGLLRRNMKNAKKN